MNLPIVAADQINARGVKKLVVLWTSSSVRQPLYNWMSLQLGSEKPRGRHRGPASVAAVYIHSLRIYLGK